MRKLRMFYSKLDFSVRYALAYIWTAVMVIAIVLGAEVDSTYFWIVPLALIVEYLFLKIRLNGF